MRSLQTRAEALKKALEVQAAPPEEVRVNVMLVKSREEVELFRQLPAVELPPRGPGPIRLTSREVDFAEHLRERGVVPPQPTIE